MRVRMQFPGRVIGGVIRVVAAVAAVALALSTGLSVARQPSSPVPSSTPAARQASNVAVITIKGEIEKVTAASVERRIALAERAGADAIVFEIDTPGGDLYAALTICNLIKQSKVPNTVAWVNTKAYSAGCVIAMACREIVLAQSVDFGDAIPIMAVPIAGLKPLAESERQKILAPLMAEIVDSARLHGRDEYLVQAFVSIGVELWLVENKATGQRLFIDRSEYKVMFGEEPPPGRPHIPSASAADGTRPSDPKPEGAKVVEKEPTPGPEVKPPAVDPSMLDSDKRFQPASPALAPIIDQTTLHSKVASKRPVITSAERGKWTLVQYVTDGGSPLLLKADDMKTFGLASQTVRDDEELKAFFGAKHIIRLDQNWSEGMVAFMTNWIVKAVLVVILLIALFIEMTHPGVIVPGIIAAGALVGLIAPAFLIGMAGWWEVAAIISGILLLVVEIFVTPGFGVIGILGLVLLFGGLVGAFVPNTGSFFPDSPQAKDDLLYGLTTVMLSMLTAFVGMYFISKHFGSLPLLGRLVLKSPDPTEVDSPSLLAAIDASGGEVKVGTTGLAITPLRPSGRVQMGDRILDVVAELGWIPAGATVKVVSSTAFRIGVELVSGPPDNPPGGGAVPGADRNA